MGTRGTRGDGECARPPEHTATKGDSGGGGAVRRPVSNPSCIQGAGRALNSYSRMGLGGMEMGRQRCVAAERAGRRRHRRRVEENSGSLPAS